MSNFLYVDTLFPFCAVSIAEIDNRITSVQNNRSRFFRSHPIHITAVHTIAAFQWMRYDLSGQKNDLDTCIIYITEAILLPPPSVPGPDSNIFQTFFFLATALLWRSKEFEQSQAEDLQHCIQYLRCLRGLSFDSFYIPRNEVSKLLIEALCLQINKLDTRDATRNMEETVLLCRELLASDISTNFPIAPFRSFSIAIITEISRGGYVQWMDGAIECLRDVVKVCPPHSHQIYLALAGALNVRFDMTFSRDDCEEAVALFEKIVDPNRPGENPDPLQVLALIGLTGLAAYRVTFNDPEDLEERISRCRSLLDCPSLPEDARSALTWALASTIRKRFEHHSLYDGLQERNTWDSEVVQIVSSQGPAVFEDNAVLEAVRETYSRIEIEQKILGLKEALSHTPTGTERHNECLQLLACWYETKFSHTNDIADIEDSIKYCQLLVDAAGSRVLARSIYLTQLCDILLRGFHRTGKIGYLDDIIAHSHDILKLNGAERTEFVVIRVLVSCLSVRIALFGRTDDVNEVMRLTRLTVDNQRIRAPDRFLLSSIWADTARCFRHPSVLEAYEKAMALMQDSLSLSPTLQIQHDRLVAMEDGCKMIPFGFASYQAGLGQFEAAIETLEQGRALLWSEIRGLRALAVGPIEEGLPLVKKLTGICQELESVTMSIAPSMGLGAEDDGTQGGDGMDAFGRLVVKQRKLVKERDVLISQVQGRPGFERFWKTPSFATLRSAASHGPVIIINHCRWRSDILILLSNAPPSIIPTPEDFFDRASKLKNQLLDVRTDRGLDSSEYELILGTVLSELYQLVGEPVIRRLRELGIPEQSRIWWCPTSVFCSLPLHAMGPIPSTDGEVNVKPQYISDLFICSYTPTLSALIESRLHNSHIPDRPSLLLVAQPDSSLPDAQAEIDVIQSQRQVQVKSLISEDATSPAVIEGLKDHRLVHFTCHGTLERAKPFDASFELYGGDRLTLLEIVRSRLPSAEFAFLAACHTAELTDESMADEGLHLVAAMQYCGFRSVVGTMWAMADIDGPDLARHFYKEMFSRKKQDVPYYERSAEALRNAVQKLRRKRKISLERWVNFVHYGA